MPANKSRSFAALRCDSAADHPEKTSTDGKKLRVYEEFSTSMRRGTPTVVAKPIWTSARPLIEKTANP